MYSFPLWLYALVAWVVTYITWVRRGGGDKAGMWAGVGAVAVVYTISQFAHARARHNARRCWNKRT
jgi:hypothetical protein